MLCLNGKVALLDDIKFLSKLSMKSFLPPGSQLKGDGRDSGLCDRSHWSALSTDTAMLYHSSYNEYLTIQ